jgi:hypothetical protein
MYLFKTFVKGDKMNPKYYLFIACILTGLALGGIGILGA